MRTDTRMQAGCSSGPSWLLRLQLLGCGRGLALLTADGMYRVDQQQLVELLLLRAGMPSRSTPTSFTPSLIMRGSSAALLLLVCAAVGASAAGNQAGAEPAETATVHGCTCKQLSDCETNQLTPDGLKYCDTTPSCTVGTVTPDGQTHSWSAPLLQRDQHGGRREGRERGTRCERERRNKKREKRERAKKRVPGASLARPFSHSHTSSPCRDYCHGETHPEVQRGRKLCDVFHDRGYDSRCPEHRHWRAPPQLGLIGRSAADLFNSVFSSTCKSVCGLPPGSRRRDCHLVAPPLYL